jgi:hypothetical protein
MPARKDRSSVHSRSVLLWAAGLFVAMQLSASLLLDYAWPLVRFPSARHVLAHLAAEPDRPDIVSLGSSRFEAGIISTEISCLLNQEFRLEPPVVFFNASVPAGDSIAGEFMIHRLLEAGARPKLLLIEISPETLNHYNDWLGLHVRRQLCWHDMPGYFLEVTRSLQLVRWLGERVNPVYYHREELWHVTAEEWQRLTGRTESKPAPASAEIVADAGPAWDKLLRPPGTPLLSETAELSRVGAFDVIRRWLRHYRIQGGNVKALERVLRLCRKEGIQVVMIGIPVTQPHRDAYTPEINREYLSFLEGLTRTYGFRFVDYRARVPDNLFVDTHHLSPEGGLYFSRVLTYEVLAPFWHGQLVKQDSRVARDH